MKYETVVTSAFGENCYILWDESTGKGIIIDPGDDAQVISSTVKKNKIEIVGIYNTHGHFDHIGAVAALKKAFQVPFGLHPGDRSLAESAETQGQLFGLDLPLESPRVDIWLDENSVVEVGSKKGRVIHTPGHTPGCVCFLFDDLLFVGDTLFAGSVGRTDLPGGNGAQLINSIQEKLIPLGDAVQVFPGHGPATTIGRERTGNPFIRYPGGYFQ